MKLTINEIARIANVAKSTVSKALNGQKGVSEENRRRILEIIDSMDYEPNASAKALAQSKTGAIGLVIPHDTHYSLSGAYWAGIITAVATEATKEGYNLLLIPQSDNSNSINQLESIIRKRSVDGLIIAAEQIDILSIERLKTKGIPFVFLGKNPQIHHYAVDVKNIDGAQRVTSILIERGYKNIACIAGPKEYIYTTDRIQGFSNALQNAGLDSTRIVYSHYSAYEARKNTSLLLQQHPDIDAVFIAAGGEFVLNILEVIRFTGIPLKKLGVGAFDDYRVYDFLECPIIAAKQPMEKMGASISRTLFSLIDGETPSPMFKEFDIELILR
ncbi:MAG TPA: LacI family DNA-binding transcriptional regulator [Treponemataceae bacterium]|nr:LacI family DNA-binding transcriptional regulator [Treponemataceae bacterium]